MIETGRLDTEVVYPARSVDPQLEFIPLTYWVNQEGHLYTWWPVAFPAMAAVFFRLMGWLGLYFVPAAAGALCAFVTGSIYVELRPGQRLRTLALALITGLATPIFFYSVRIWEHTLNTLFFLLAWLFLIRGLKSEQWKYYALSALCASFSVFFRVETAAYWIGLGIVLLIFNWRKAFIFGASAVAASVPWLLFNWLVYGNLFGHQLSTFGQTGFLGGLAKARLSFLPYFLFNAPSTIGYNLPKIWLVIASIMVAGIVIFAFIPRLRKLSLVAFALLTAICVSGLVTPTGYFNMSGFLLLSPLALQSVWYFAFKEHWKDKLPVYILGSWLLFALVFILKAWVQAGGTQWGARYLLPLYPMMVLLLFLAIDTASGRLRGWEYKAFLAVSCFAALVGFGYEIRGVATSIKLLQITKTATEAVLAIETPVISTDCRYFAQLSPEAYLKKKLVYVPDDRLDAWMKNAKDNRIDSFDRVSFDFCRFLPLDQVSSLLSKEPTGIHVQTFDLYSTTP